MGVEPPTNKDVKNILNCLDSDGDGSVDKEEFASLIMMVFE